MTGTDLTLLALLLLMALFMVWACLHTDRRRTWWQDERDAEAFLAELHAVRDPTREGWVDVPLFDEVDLTPHIARIEGVTSALARVTWRPQRVEASL